MSATHFTNLPDFSAPLTHEDMRAVSKTIEEELVRDNIIRLAKYLLKLEGRKSLIGHPNVSNDAYTMSLRTLYDRLHDGKVAPTDLENCPFIDNNDIKHRITAPTNIPLAERPLADLEDLYYLVVARIKEIHHILTTRVKSGFCTLSTPVFDKHSPSIDLFIHVLSSHWDTLNSAEVGKTLDNAVRSARAAHIVEEINARVEANEVSTALAQAQIWELMATDVFSDIRGIWHAHGFAPAMIVKCVEKKYEDIFREEKEATLKTTLRETTKRRVVSRTTRGPDSKRGKRIAEGTLNTKGLFVWTGSDDHTDDCANLVNELTDLNFNDLNLSGDTVKSSCRLALSDQLSPFDGSIDLTLNDAVDFPVLTGASYNNDLSLAATKPDDCCDHNFFSPKKAYEHNSQFTYTAEEFAGMVANAKPLVSTEQEVDVSMEDQLDIDIAAIQEDINRLCQQYNHECLEAGVQWEPQNQASCSYNDNLWNYSVD